MSDILNAAVVILALIGLIACSSKEKETTEIISYKISEGVVAFQTYEKAAYNRDLITISNQYLKIAELYIELIDYLESPYLSEYSESQILESVEVWEQFLENFQNSMDALRTKELPSKLKVALDEHFKSNEKTRLKQQEFERELRRRINEANEKLRSYKEND